MKLNGHYYFSKRQLELMLKGREVTFWRGGAKLVAGLKHKHKQADIAKLQHKLDYYAKKLKAAGVKI